MQYIKLEFEQDICVLTIDRHAQLNALNFEVLEQLSQAVAMIKAINSLRAVIITGTGRAFVAGADIQMLHDAHCDKAIAFNKFGSDVFRSIELLPLATIAAVNGYALGGGLELALCADIRIAAESAVFSCPETTLGQIPGFGGTQRLPRLIGMGLAKEMIFTARKVSAAQALAMGLVNSVVPCDELMAACTRLALDVKKASAFAIATAKRVMDNGAALPLDDGLRLEYMSSGPCHDTSEQKQATLAFLNKASSHKKISE